VRKQQVSSQLMLKAVEEIGGDFPILKETYREILEDIMDLPRAGTIIKSLISKDIVYKIIDTPVPSPFSHMMMTFGEADVIMMHDRRKHLRELHKEVMKRIRGVKK
jgi:ATP-dependent Lhr-like helicase